MVANVSHDLRTPLTALIGQLETIRMKAEGLDRESRDRFVDAAIHNAHHLRRLTDALNELAKLDNPELRIEREPIALGELADDLAQRYGIRAEEAGVSLRVTYPDHLPLARVDAGLIERAIGNLLDNAIRVTPQGGTIELRVVRDADGLRVEVADSGPGVADDDQSKVFQRFYQGQQAPRAAGQLRPRAGDRQARRRAARRPGRARQRTDPRRDLLDAAADELTVGATGDRPRGRPCVQPRGPRAPRAPPAHGSDRR